MTPPAKAMNEQLRREAFVDLVKQQGAMHYRDFAWRRTTDPYAILISEIMLQQTQTTRVERYFDKWMRRFPTVMALSDAELPNVLEAWAGLGYNRRALALKRAAVLICKDFSGALPRTESELLSLPGVGPATAAAISAFAYDRPSLYLETNVRSVLLHEFFPSEESVGDRMLLPLLSEINEIVRERGIGARVWNYALLDYGAYLKRTLPNPSRRSKHYSRQSPYEGSRRQKRARLLESVLATPGQTTAALANAYGYEAALTQSILEDLAAEGFITRKQDCWLR